MIDEMHREVNMTTDEICRLLNAHLSLLWIEEKLEGGYMCSHNMFSRSKRPTTWSSFCEVAWNDALESNTGDSSLISKECINASPQLEVKVTFGVTFTT